MSNKRWTHINFEQLVANTYLLIELKSIQIVSKL